MISRDSHWDGKMLADYHHVINCLKIYFKTTKILSWFLYQELKSRLDSGSGSGSLTKLLLRHQSSEDLTGAGGPASKMSPSHDCWQETSVPAWIFVGRLSSSLMLEHTLDVAAAGFSQGEQSKTDQRRSKAHASWDLVLGVTHCHFYLIPFFKSKSLSSVHA